MPATLLDCGLVILGGFLGLILQNRISERFTTVLNAALGLCVLGIGMASAIRTQDTLCLIACMVIGALIGEALSIEARLDALGRWLKRRLHQQSNGNARFTEGFVSASLLYCIGAMAVMGAMDAGIRGDYTILITKSVMDGVIAISLAAALGIGVLFSAFPIFLYQGTLTLLASFIGPYLSDAVILEMSAVGGLLIVGISLNMLDLSKRKVPVGNLLPAIFLPIAYLPLSHFLSQTVPSLF